MGKRAVHGHRLVDAAAVTTSHTSDSINVKYLDNVAFQVLWSGGAASPVGAFTVEASLDGANWTVLSFGSAISQSGDSGGHLININQCPFEELRVKYTRSSGTGSIVLTVYVTAKGLGA